MKKIIKVCLSTFLGAGAILALASCGKSGSKIVDYTSECKLTRNYEGKTFFENGIEEATLNHCTDGDTSTFKLKSGRTITVRYLGIDTPESTAGYEKWGKAASLWNKSILENASQIVIESNDESTHLDSNGTRYLAYVWYKSSSDSEWRNLNIETVQEGYSNYTGTSSSIKADYHTVFTNASKQAKENKLKVNGSDEDIYYPDEIKTVTLKDLNENYSAYYNEETSVPTHVAFEAYLVSLTVSSSSFINATVEQIVDGQAYQFDITVGYSSSGIGQKFTSSDLGTLYYICGFTASGNTIHGLVPKTVKDGDQYTIKKTVGYSMKFDNIEIQSIDTQSSDSYRITVKKGSKTYKLFISLESGQTLTLNTNMTITTKNRYLLDSDGYYHINSSDITTSTK